MDNYHDRLGKCEDLIQGQGARLRKCTDFMHQHMTQMEETMTKISGSVVMDRAPCMGGHGLRSEHPWRDMYSSGMSTSHEYPPTGARVLVTCSTA